MSGIHHVTAISGKAARNLDFYTRTLGLRFVKKTVNFDDPGTYHLYYGDEIGHPGTILTFFPWEDADPGRAGIGLAQQTAFRVPMSSIGFWTHRLVAKGIAHESLEKRFDEPVLSFKDPDGLSLALVGVSDAEGEETWADGGVPAKYAIRGFHGVTLMIGDSAGTAAILKDVLEFKEVGEEGPYLRFRADQTVGGVVDIREAREFLAGQMGRGSVHHVAFRAIDDAAQAAMARKVVENHGLRHTPKLDRQYFRSVYFREPGGVLFEIATDAPGFAVDEPVASLGKALKLPPFLEPRRQEIEAALPTLENLDRAA
jgi:glyoxalase family protein